MPTDQDRDRDETSGQYVQKATVDDVAAVFDTVEGPPVVTSADVADATGLSRDSARRKLETLRDRGQAAKRMSAGRSLYWPTESERRETAESPTSGDGVATTATGRDGERGGPERRETAESDGDDDGVSDAVEAALRGWTYGRNETEREASRRVAREATAWLRDGGYAARKVDVPLDQLAEADPQGRTEDTLWSQVVRPAWRHAADRGYVRRPNSRNYQWAGDGDGE